MIMPACMYKVNTYDIGLTFELSGGALFAPSAEANS
jgi:hypothetical protein